MADPSFIAARILEGEPGSPRGPATLEFYPTLRCNLNCKFCDSTDRHRPGLEEVPPERQLQVLDQAMDLGVRTVLVLGGGEPLAAPGRGELLRRVKENGFEGILTTNGTLLDLELERRMVALGWDEIHYSVDAPVAAIHDTLRGAPGALRRTLTSACRVRGLREQAGALLPRTALHFVLTRHNHRTLPAMVRLARALGAGRVDFDALIVYQEAQRALALEPWQVEEMPHIVRETQELARELGIQTTVTHLQDPRNLARGSEGENPLAVERPAPGRGLASVHCLRPWHHLVVAANGRTGPCCVLADLGSSVKHAPLRQIWEEDPFFTGLRESFLAGTPHPRCRECSANILVHERAIRARLGESLC